MISRLTASATVFALAATTVIVLLANAAVRPAGADEATRQVVQLPLVEVVVTRGARG